MSGSRVWERRLWVLPMVVAVACNSNGDDAETQAGSWSASDTDGVGTSAGPASSASGTGDTEGGGATASGGSGGSGGPQGSTDGSGDASDTDAEPDETDTEGTDDTDGTGGFGDTEGSTGEGTLPDDNPGEVMFDASATIQTGWYQYYQGSTQYRAAGEVFAVAASDEAVHIVHDSSSSSAGLRYHEDSKGTWNSTSHLTDPIYDYVPSSVSVALDSESLPSMAVGGLHYVNYPSSVSSAHAYFYDGYLWNVAHPAPSMSGPRVRSLDMAIDAEDRRHVIYVARWEGHDDTLLYATADASGDDWAVAPVESTYELTTLSRKSCAIAVDEGGDVHVVYTRDNPDAVGNESDTIVSYARRSANGGAWNKQTVEDYLIVRDRVDIAVSDDGTPHVAMAENMFSAMWYATVVGDAWESEMVDDVGDVGGGHAIAVDEYGRPHISYVDRTERQLRYARRLASGWDRYAPADTYRDSAGSCGGCNTPIETDLVVRGTEPVIVVGGFDLDVVRAVVP